MENKYGLPEGWTTQIEDSTKETTITLDRLQLRILLDQIQNGCVNEYVNPVYEAVYKTISEAYWKLTRTE